MSFWPSSALRITRFFTSLSLSAPRPRLTPTAIPANPATPTAMAAATPSASTARPTHNGNPTPSRVGALADRVTAEYTRGPDVWSTFTPAVFPDCVNLGQGFMNWAPPAFIKDALRDFTDERIDVHHYSHPKGRPRLRQALADTQSASYRKPRDASKDVVSSGATPQLRADEGVALDPETEIQVTAGANGAIYCAMTAFLEPGDEVIFLSPHFDQYECEVTFMGATPLYVPLLPPAQTQGSLASDWQVDWAALEAAMARPRCRAIIFNTPHNPIGKVYSLEELQKMAALCVKYDQLVVSDEVYDILTFDNQPHIRIAALEGMWNRTITIGSGGKTFAATGWRIGWAVGPEHLIKPILVVHTRITFCTNSVAAEAVAVGLERAPALDFYEEQRREYAARRRQLGAALDALGLPYTVPQGAYFIMADASALAVPDDYQFPETLQPHYRLAYFVAKEAKVVCIPATAFVSKEHVPLYESWLRFSFCKDEGGKGGGDIEEAGRRLQALKKYIKAK